jgi:hypothetical protein
MVFETADQQMCGKFANFHLHPAGGIL